MPELPFRTKPVPRHVSNNITILCNFCDINLSQTLKRFQVSSNLIKMSLANALDTKQVHGRVFFQIIQDKCTPAYL